MIIRNLKKIILIIVISFNFIIKVDAMNVPSNVVLKPKSNLYYYSETNGTDYINGYNFYQKVLTDGTLAYCSSNIDTHVPAGKTLSLKGEVEDIGLEYIIKNGYPNISFTNDSKKDYYITQAAIWRYYDETRESNNWNSSTFTNSSIGMKKYVYNLVQEAKAFKKTNQPSNIFLIITNKTMNLVGEEFVSEPIKITSSNMKNSFEVSILNAPIGTTIRSINKEVRNVFSNGEEFIIVTPRSSVKGNIKVKVSGIGIEKKLYEYTTKDSYYQDLVVASEYDSLKEKVDVELDLNYGINTKVRISKKDSETKEELSGAVLEILDINGNLIESFVSNNSPYYIEGLKIGKYILIEKESPKGYALNKEKINFTVKDNNVTDVVMYNTKLVDVPITDLNINKTSVVLGFTFILFGSTILVVCKKYF